MKNQLRIQNGLRKVQLFLDGLDHLDLSINIERPETKNLF